MRVSVSIFLITKILLEKTLYVSTIDLYCFYISIFVHVYTLSVPCWESTKLKVPWPASVLYDLRNSFMTLTPSTYLCVGLRGPSLGPPGGDITSVLGCGKARSDGLHLLPALPAGGGPTFSSQHSVPTLVLPVSGCVLVGAEWRPTAASGRRRPPLVLGGRSVWR